MIAPEDNSNTSNVDGPMQLQPEEKKPRSRTASTSSILTMLQSRGDADNDGKITKEELENFFSHVDLNEALVSQYRKLLFVQTVAAVLIIIVLATVTGLAVQLSKESHVMDATFVGKDGTAVQCASKELEVGSDGLLTMKKNEYKDGIIQDETESQKTVIRTLKAPSVSHPLNSKVPDKYLRRLVEFTAKVDGQEQYVKVDSFRRVIDVTTECGSYVLLTTNLGEFKLDTTHLWHNGGKVEVVGAFTKGRKLKALDLEAFYDDVADMEFECKLVWQQEEEEIKKPSLPPLPMSFVAILHHPCTTLVNDVLQDVCTSTLGANARQSKPGVSAEGDYVIQVDHVLVTETEKITVSYLPNHPLQKKVVIHNKTGAAIVTEYQLYRDNKDKFHCESHQINNAFEMDLESLHYLGVGTHDNVPVRKWAVGVLGEQGNTTKIAEEFKQESHLTDHSYVEFWDTDDGDHYPYYGGIMDTEKTSLFNKAFYKSFKVGLTPEEVTAWVDSELQGTYKDEKRTCRQSRKKLRKMDGSYIYIPGIIDATSELNSDVQFYVDELPSSGSVPPVAYQGRSYDGYWALAAHGHAKPQGKTQLHVNNALLDAQYDTCENLPETAMYKLCLERLKTEFEHNKKAEKEGLKWGGGGNRTLQNVNNRGRRLATATKADCADSNGKYIEEPETTKNGARIYYKTRTTLVEWNECFKDCLAPAVHTTEVKGSISDSIDAGGLEITYGRGWEYIDEDIPEHKLTMRYFSRCEIDKKGYRWYKGAGCAGPFCTSDMYPQWHRDEDLDLTLPPTDYVPIDKIEVPRPAKITKSTVNKLILGGKGEFGALKTLGFSQTFSATGELKFITSNGNTDISGKLELVYTASRQKCAAIWVKGMKAGLSGSIGVSAEVTTKPTGETKAALEGFGSFSGYAGAYFKSDFWDGCSCQGNHLANCDHLALGGQATGKMYIKFNNLACDLQVDMDIGFSIEFSVGIGPFAFNYNNKWDIVKGKKIGDKMKC